MCRAVLSDAVVARWAPHAPDGRPWGLSRWVMSASASLRDRVRVEFVLSFELNDAVHHGITYSMRVVLEFL